MNDAFLWTAWFSVICALQLFAQLSKLRFEYVSIQLYAYAQIQICCA